MRSLACVLPAVLLFAGMSSGETAPDPASAGPESAALSYFYGDYAKKNLLAAADAMPESGYSFRPVDSVRTFGEILAHIADTQYLFCSSAKGEQNPHPGAEGPGRSTSASYEKTAKTRAEIRRALAESFAYCDGVFAGLRDANLAEGRKLIGNDRTLALVSTLAVVHLSEHYGQVTVYLRMKGLVPPSSQPGPEAARSGGE